MKTVLWIKPKGKRFLCGWDDGETWNVSEEFLADNALKKGSVLDEDSYAELRAVYRALEAKRQVLLMLGRKDYTVRELYRKLKEKSLEDYADEAVGYAVERGYQDDYRCGLQAAKAASEKYGKNRVEQMLYQRGIRSETVSAICEEVFGELPQDDRALEMLKKIAKDKQLSDSKEKNKLYAKLARLGFSSSEIRSAFTRLGEDL